MVEFSGDYKLIDAEVSAETIIHTSVSYESRPDSVMVAARLTDLGLTAYGLTQDEARDGVLRLFGRWVQHLHERDILEESLDRLQVSWSRRFDNHGREPITLTTNTRKAIPLT